MQLSESRQDSTGQFLAVVATLQPFVCVDEAIEALRWGVQVERFPGSAVELYGGGHEGRRGCKRAGPCSSGSTAEVAIDVLIRPAFARGCAGRRGVAYPPFCLSKRGPGGPSQVPSCPQGPDAISVLQRSGATCTRSNSKQAEQSALVRSRPVESVGAMRRRPATRSSGYWQDQEQQPAVAGENTEHQHRPRASGMTPPHWQQIPCHRSALRQTHGMSSSLSWTTSEASGARDWAQAAQARVHGALVSTIGVTG